MTKAASFITRRTFLASTAVIGAYGASGTRSAFADVNWKKYAGTKIGVNLVKSPRGDVLQKHEKEFTDLTGIQVSSEQTPEQQQRQKAVIELNSGSPSSTSFTSAFTCRSVSSKRPIGWLTLPLS
jgi:multiple sugar transport system substrate-binding protein